MTDWGRTPERRFPDAIVMEAVGLTSREARVMSQDALLQARVLAPKLTGSSARRMQGVFGMGFFGIHWRDPHVFFQEMGIRAFTMRSLAGKTIPMWIDDPTGEERRKNPRARTRRTASGKVQVLIFRRAAEIGSRKQAVGRFGTVRWVPRSYPGAPGRITIREAGTPQTTLGRVPGAIARPNVGVRWRHPGLWPRSFIHQSLLDTAFNHGVVPGPTRSVILSDYRQRPRRVA